jgi:prevent-host-death family protein
MSNPVPPPGRVSVEGLRTHWGEHIERVIVERRPLEVTRHGRTAVYIVPAALWQELIAHLP